MRQLITILLALLSLSRGTSQSVNTIPTPEVKVTISLSKDTFKLGDDVQLTMTLRNGTVRKQSVLFDRPKSSIGGPAWTFVTVVNKKTGKSVLKYQNKRILESQVYDTEQIKLSSYQLEPGQSVEGRFSLYDMVVTDTKSYRLGKGIYILQVFYAMNPSNIISFTVD